MRRFNKGALATAVAAVVGGSAMTAHAEIEGIVGEAFLVPFAVTGNLDGPEGNEINTLISVYTPRFVGGDTLTTLFTASNTTDQWLPNANPPSYETGESLNTTPDGFYLHPGAAPGSSIRSPSGHDPDTLHWYWFDHESKHQQNDTFNMTPDDVHVLDLSQLNVPDFEPGYMLITDDSAVDGDPANLAFSVDAILEIRNSDQDFEGNPNAVDFVRMPTYAMSDGADPEIPASGQLPPPEIGNEVVYDSGGIPQQYAPLITGIRLNDGDGTQEATVASWFDLFLDRSEGPDATSTNPDLMKQDMHVIWLPNNDENRTGVTTFVFNDDEARCSMSLDLPWELNVMLWRTFQGDNGDIVSQVHNLSTLYSDVNTILSNTELFSLLIGDDLPLPNSDDACFTPNEQPVYDEATGDWVGLSQGFVRYSLPEIEDQPTDVGQPSGTTAAGAAFDIHFRSGDGDNVNVLRQEDYTLRLAHERGLTGPLTN